MAQSLQRFGCAVTIFEVAPQLLPREDPDAAKLRTGVHISDLYETSAPNIYSCGDCASPYKFTHAADWQARCAVRNMFLQANSKHSDLLVPWATYTDPEIAHVGLYEKEMDDKGIAYDTYVRQFKDVDRCKCEGVTSGFVKISCAKGSDQILGSTIVGPCAGDLISEITVCMQNGIGCKDIAGLRTPAVNAAIEKRLEQVATGTVPEKTDMMAGAAESLNKAVGDVTASVTAMFK
ncbi:dihydrolipoyl dehydrogenase [Aureococcus anophagefferens]|nr:dihydrolipoyl dehydrogenase [Aureococcus anophagefferens]